MTQKLKEDAEVGGKIAGNARKELENKLHNLLTLDTKVSLEINELMKEINGK